MPLEMHPEPDSAIRQAIQICESNAEHYRSKSEVRKAYDKKLYGEGFLEDSMYQHSDAATHDRYAEVYRQTAEELAQMYLKYRRNMERASNPYYAEYTDEQIDEIFTQREEDIKAYEQRMKAMSLSETQ